MLNKSVECFFTHIYGRFEWNFKREKIFGEITKKKPMELNQVHWLHMTSLEFEYFFFWCFFGAASALFGSLFRAYELWMNLHFHETMAFYGNSNRRTALTSMAFVCIVLYRISVVGLAAFCCPILLSTKLVRI